MNTAEMAKRVLEEADVSKHQVWFHDIGVLGNSVRIDVPLRQSQEVLHMLRWLADELPDICARIERETDERRRLLVAQWELQAVRGKVKRKRRR